MSGIESVLAADDRLDGRIEACRAELDSELDDIRNGLFEDVIDWTAVNDGFTEKADWLSIILGAENERERDAVIRGTVFARQILIVMYGDEQAGIALPDYIGESNVPKMRKLISKDTTGYLNNNPNVKEFIDDNMVAVDGGLGCAEIAEQAFTFLIMAGERYYAERMLERAVGDLSPELFA